MADGLVKAVAADAVASGSDAVAAVSPADDAPSEAPPDDASAVGSDAAAAVVAAASVAAVCALEERVVLVADGLRRFLTLDNCAGSGTRRGSVVIALDVNNANSPSSSPGIAESKKKRQNPHLPMVSGHHQHIYPT